MASSFINMYVFIAFFLSAVNTYIRQMFRTYLLTPNSISRMYSVCVYGLGNIDQHWLIWVMCRVPCIDTVIRLTLLIRVPWIETVKWIERHITSLKTYLRNTVSDERLNHLAIINTERVAAKAVGISKLYQNLMLFMKIVELFYIRWLVLHFFKHVHDIDMIP